MSYLAFRGLDPNCENPACDVLSGRFAYKSIRLHWSRLAYTIWVDSLTFVASVCVFKFVYASSFSSAEEKFWVIKKMSSDSEWSSFTELSSTSEEDTMEEDIEEIYGLDLEYLATEIFLITFCYRGPQI